MTHKHKKISVLAATSLALGSLFLAAAQQSPAQQQPRAPAAQKNPAKGRIQLPDMTDHPLAGMTLEIEIAARDGLGQQGQSKKVKVTLPKRNFKHPAAQSLANMRRTLTLDSRTAPDSIRELDRIIRTQGGTMSAESLNALKEIHKNMAAAKDDLVLDQAVKDMWPVMLQLENEMLTSAEKKLKEAEKNLRDALQRGASDEELRKLMEAARKAMEDALKEKRDNAEKDKDPQAQKDFEDMRKMMEEMRKMMENLDKNTPVDKMSQQMQQAMEQMGQMGQGQSQSGQNQNQNQNQNQQQQRQDLKQSLERMRQQMRQMQQQQDQQKALKELQEIIKRQQDLRNDTNKEGGNKSPQTGDSREDLEKLARQLSEKINQKIEEKEPVPDKPAHAPRSRAPVFNASAIRLAQFQTSTQATVAGDPTLDQLRKMDSDVKQIEGNLKNKKEKNQPLTDKEEQETFERLKGIAGKLGSPPPRPQPPGQPQNGNPPPQNQMGGKKSGELGQRQQDLKRQLETLMNEMSEKGMDPGKMGDANGEMGNASGQLKKGKPGEAVPNQDKALEALKEAEKEMQQQMMKAQGLDPGQRDDPEDDKVPPLGRYNPNKNIGANPAAEENRTRAIRDDIRRRLEKPGISKTEREYLERLLKGTDPAQGQKPGAAIPK